MILLTISYFSDCFFARRLIACLVLVALLILCLGAAAVLAEMTISIKEVRAVSINISKRLESKRLEILSV